MVISSILQLTLQDMGWGYGKYRVRSFIVTIGEKGVFPFAFLPANREMANIRINADHLEPQRYRALGGGLS